MANNSGPLTKGLIVIAIFANICSAYRNGAPCKAEHSLRPSATFHGTAQNIDSNPPPYTFTVENDDGTIATTYQPGKTYIGKILFLKNEKYMYI